ncbi:MAG: SHOCT-like domain-containing protein [Candidatus Sericytochromatia bacterium]
MDEEQLKILEMVANKLITPEQAAKLLEGLNESITLNTPEKNIIPERIVKFEKYNFEDSLDINIDLGITNFKLTKIEDSDFLYKLEYIDNEEFKSKAAYYNKQLQITGLAKRVNNLDLSTLQDFVDPVSKKMILELNKNVKYFFKVKLGGGNAFLDFSDLRLKRLRLSSGACDTKIVFGNSTKEEIDYLKFESGASNLDIKGISNTNCPEIELSLGACNTSLDYSGNLSRNIYTDISVRVGKINLLIPEEYGVKIKSSGKLNDFKSTNLLFRDDYRVSKNIDKAKNILEFFINTNMAQVNLTWI